MNGKAYFSGENEIENIISLSSADLAERSGKVKHAGLIIGEHRSSPSGSHRSSLSGHRIGEVRSSPFGSVIIIAFAYC